MTILRGMAPRSARGRPAGQLPMSPDAIEREYYITVIDPFLEKFDEQVQRILVRSLESIASQGKVITQDSLSLDVDRPVGALFTQLEEVLASLLSSVRLTPAVATIGVKTAGHAALTVKRQIEALVTSNLGITLGSVPGLQERIDLFTRENVGLIKTIAQGYLDDVQSTMIRGIRVGDNAREIGAEISERFRVSKSRGRLIADDQINKFHGELRRARQKSLGITEYIWRTRSDVRVRSEHAAREGKRFSFNKPPSDGHPGHPIRCRCFEDPILPF